jgi:hypothetical protein
MPSLLDARDTYPTTLAFVSERAELPFLLNHRLLLGCGVEVGVKEGEFSETILRHWRGHHLISVNPWRADAPDRYADLANVPQAQHETFYQTALRRLAPFGERSSIWRMTSLDASRLIPLASLDFVYIDARHDFASVLEDLNAWFDKVRPGGIIAGHDYLDGVMLNPDGTSAGDVGVRSAVDRFFAAREVVVYPTLLDEPALSWMAVAPLAAELAVDL